MFTSLAVFTDETPVLFHRSHCCERRDPLCDISLSLQFFRSAQKTYVAIQSLQARGAQTAAQVSAVCTPSSRPFIIPCKAVKIWCNADFWVQEDLPPVFCSDTARSSSAHFQPITSSCWGQLTLHH